MRGKSELTINFSSNNYNIISLTKWIDQNFKLNFKILKYIFRPYY